MSRLTWLKSNTALVIGISLPVLLVILLWLATVIPRLTVPDPEFDVIFSADHYDDSAPIDGAVRFVVRDGRLQATFHADQRHNFGNIPRLYFFDVSSGNIHEISLDIPTEMSDGQQLQIPEATAYKLSNKRIAPDGYSFDASYSGGGGFLFFTGGYHYRGSIRKDNRVIKIPLVGQPYRGDLHFLGWVVAGARP